jgi:hypothetical protein
MITLKVSFLFCSRIVGQSKETSATMPHKRRKYKCDNCNEEKQRDEFYPKDPTQAPSTSKCIDCRKENYENKKD